MAFLKWGWLLHKKSNSSIKYSIWKRRYLVLTTTSICIHKSEKGVISHKNQRYKSYGWSNFQNVKRQGTHAFLVESRYPKLYASLYFQSKNDQERNHWLQAIYEQLHLTLKRWSFNQTTNSCLSTSSVLDKWLDHYDMTDHTSFHSISSESTAITKKRTLLSRLASLFF
ncbi:hypothetical protein EDC96DRAFT_548416 [Choanephora cucurbitarum]|nr:hypothetical protein EDC96DRAFT_548416 [Choanephora cucurbitarum]